jgi:hypothetical protein
MTEELNLPKILYHVTGTFEYELLVELVLRHWEHPFAADEEYRNFLLESTAELLAQASSGVQYGEMPANETNLIYALWYVESSATSQEPESAELAKRKKWLKAMRKSLPSCFCSQDMLG